MPSTSVRSSWVVALSLGITALAVVAPSALFDNRSPISRAVLETVIALVGTLVAFLAFGRFRRSQNAQDLLIVCAVALLAWSHTLIVVALHLAAPASVGNGVGVRFDFWGTIVVRVVAAGYFVAAAQTRSVERERIGKSRIAVSTLLAPVAAGTTAVVLLVWLAPISQDGSLGQVSWTRSVWLVLHLLGALLFFMAFYQLSVRAKSLSDPFLGWIGTGCVFGGFAMISYALLAVGGAIWLRSGDLLRVAAVCTWALGAIWEILSYWAKIAESARNETRREVALELHDGLAQELALLAAYMHAPTDERAIPEWHEQMQATTERALAEARRSIATLAGEIPVPLGADLERAADFVSGTDVRVRVDVGAGTELTATDPLQRESIVRIVREAVTNAVRHGCASRIDIVYGPDTSPSLRISDDGVGFDTDHISTSGRFGFVSMRERAEAIGASLTVQSAPGQGTTVEVLWP